MQSKRYFLDETWIPESPIECYNSTKQDKDNCEGCIMREHTNRTIWFSKLQNKNIEFVNQDRCIWFMKLIEANQLYLKVQELKMRLQNINEISETTNSKLQNKNKESKI